MFKGSLQATGLSAGLRLQTLDNAAVESHLKTILKAIHEIYHQNASHLSFEMLYRYCYQLVLSKQGKYLYSEVSKTVRSHLEEAALDISKAKNEDVHRMIVTAWSSNKVAFGMIKDILMYMDSNEKKIIPIYTMLLKQFREVIIYHPQIRERMRLVLLENISLERSGCIIDRDLMKSLLAMLLDLGVDGVNVYEDDFEHYFLEESKQFYRVESMSYLSQNSCQDYISKVEVRLLEESKRVSHYLSSQTDGKLRSITENELILTHCKTLLEMDSSGFVCMLRDNKLNDLRRMYTLFLRIPACVEQMRDAMGKYVKQSGFEILDNQETNKDPVLFLKLILELKDKFDSIIKESFRSEKKMQKKLKESFEDFINKDHRCASHLASYIDDLLRTGLNGVSEEEVDSKLEKTIVIFKYISDKDVFENYYKNLLSKRLLGGKTVSDEVEKSMIAKLKAECGYQFTTKLEGMFVDMNISKTLMEQYKQFIAGSSSSSSSSSAIAGKGPAQCNRPQLSNSNDVSNSSVASLCDLDVMMLSTSNWPLTATPECILPPTLMACCKHFGDFYFEMHSGRKLIWMTHLGSCDLKAAFPTGRKELSVSTYQICILMLFNQQDTISLSSIRHATNIPELELRRHLLSLCTPKLKILKKSSKGKNIEAEDEFTFNAEFNSKFKRIKVPLVSAREVVMEGSEGAAEFRTSDLPASVDEERRHLVEAAIVRIMKARKAMSHLDLVAEVTRQLSHRFTTTPPFIKKRVEGLIEREYIERAKDDARIYKYLA
eukprot:gene26477-35136_t